MSESHYNRDGSLTRQGIISRDTSLINVWLNVASTGEGEAWEPEFLVQKISDVTAELLWALS